MHRIEFHWFVVARSGLLNELPRLTPPAHIYMGMEASFSGYSSSYTTVALSLSPFPLPFPSSQAR